MATRTIYFKNIWIVEVVLFRYERHKLRILELQVREYEIMLKLSIFLTFFARSGNLKLLYREIIAQTNKQSKIVFAT